VPPSSQPPGVIGIGYEGRDIDSFVRELQAAQVARLVDVRLTPISRKPGFSKSALRAALAGVGIAYEHRRELGNPKANRAGFQGSPEELRAARKAYAARLAEPEARRAIEELARAATTERIAVLCFEADQRRCHRDLVVDEVARRLKLGDW